MLPTLYEKATGFNYIKVLSESRNISMMIRHPIAILCHMHIHIVVRRGTGYFQRYISKYMQNMPI